MPKSTVTLVRCESYLDSEVLDAVSRGIELLGGASSFVKPGENILLKPNILVGDNPEKCISTHPEVFKAAGIIFGSAGCNLLYGDSPGFGKPSTQMRKAGISQAAEQAGMKPADFDSGNEIPFPNSPFVKKFFIARGVTESDGLISISKMKTHMLTRITGAIKNQFGCIHGFKKAEYHVKMPDPVDFSKMLVSLNLLLKPRLYIMDAVMAMEGNGPRSGNPVKMNVLLFSKDPIALDAVVCRIINLSPEYIPTSRPGRDWELGTFMDADIELTGDPLKSFINKNFKVDRKPPVFFKNNSAVSFIKNIVSTRPYIIGELCKRCGVCIEVCPVNPKALNWSDNNHENKENPPVYDYKKCIRCFCCQELCPERAIETKKPFLGRII